MQYECSPQRVSSAHRASRTAPTAPRKLLRRCPHRLNGVDAESMPLCGSPQASLCACGGTVNETHTANKTRRQTTGRLLPATHRCMCCSMSCSARNMTCRLTRLGHRWRSFGPATCWAGCMLLRVAVTRRRWAGHMLLRLFCQRISTRGAVGAVRGACDPAPISPRHCAAPHYLHAALPVTPAPISPRQSRMQQLWE